jgi:5-methylcytosine-specific restriction endonuclease McrA
MSARFPKHPRVKLPTDAFAELCRQVFDRHGWRGQSRGCWSHLQVRHIQFRSSLGGDILENLITLCARCHDELHRAP